MIIQRDRIIAMGPTATTPLLQDTKVIARGKSGRATLLRVVGERGEADGKKSWCVASNTSGSSILMAASSLMSKNRR
ncbi:MAG: hypothetical protein HC794_05475 [Nitrospiraceae bacterium]|nr:hypothetical protein [Nitrospiraceae bacterium]